MKKRILKKVMIGLAALMGWMVFQGGLSRSQAEEIKVGVISTASGNLADLGGEERKGITMAAEEFNARGGVLGKKIRLYVEDDESDPSVAARKARRLIEGDNVDFLVGVVSSSSAIAVGEVAERYGKVYICTNANSDEITAAKAKRVLFRVPPDMSMVLRANGPWVADHLGKKWYFFTHDYTAGWSATGWARQVLKNKGGIDLGEIKVPMGTRDFSSFLLKARAAKPDVLVITVVGFDGQALREQIYEFGTYKEMKIFFTLIDPEDSYSMGKEKAVGYPGQEWNVQIGAPGVEEFRAKYKKRWPSSPYPEPGVNLYNGYLGMRELLRAVERAGTTKTANVIKALEGHVITDSLKHWPIKIREWDHQFLTGIYLSREKTPSEMKFKSDFFEVISKTDGATVARTMEENPVKLGPYPE